MADEEQDNSGGIPRLMLEFIGQLRSVTERLEGLPRVGASLPPALSQTLSSLRNLPTPGVVSAAQLDALATNVSAQRRSIQTLKADLEAFDWQLAALERLLGPLVEWSRTWADIEERLTGRRHAG